MNAKGEALVTEDNTDAENEERELEEESSSAPALKASVTVKMKRRPSLRTQYMKMTLNKKDIPPVKSTVSSSKAESSTVPDECPTPTSTRSKKAGFSFSDIKSEEKKVVAAEPSAPKKLKEKNPALEKAEMLKKLLVTEDPKSLAKVETKEKQIEIPTTTVLLADVCPSPTSSRAKAMSSRVLSRSQSVYGFESPSRPTVPMPKPSTSADESEGILSKRSKTTATPLDTIMSPGGFKEMHTPSSQAMAKNRFEFPISAPTKKALPSDKDSKPKTSLAS